MRDCSAGAAALAVEFAIASVKPIIRTAADCRIRMALVVIGSELLQIQGVPNKPMLDPFAD